MTPNAGKDLTLEILQDTAIRKAGEGKREEVVWILAKIGELALATAYEAFRPEKTDGS